MSEGVVTTFRVDDASTIEQLWAVYHGAFSADAGLCIQDQQCYDRDAFISAMLDAEYVKIILLEAGEAVAFCMGTNNLEKARIAYLNPVRLKALYPDEARAGAIWYMTSFAVRNDLRRTGRSETVLHHLAAFAAGRDAIIAFDFASDKMPGFAEYVVKKFLQGRGLLGLAFDDAEYAPLGGQTYGAVRFVKKQ